MLYPPAPLLINDSEPQLELIIVPPVLPLIVSVLVGTIVILFDPAPPLVSATINICPLGASPTLSEVYTLMPVQAYLWT